jgi:hypothetical protein
VELASIVPRTALLAQMIAAMGDPVKTEME